MYSIWKTFYKDYKFDSERNLVIAEIFIRSDNKRGTDSTKIIPGVGTMWNTNTLEWIDIELTSFCNIRCKGCFRVLSKEADKILNKTYLDIETIREKF